LNIQDAVANTGCTIASQQGLLGLVLNSAQWDRMYAEQNLKMAIMESLELTQAMRNATKSTSPPEGSTKKYEHNL
jgi:hypothetical protein